MTNPCDLERNPDPVYRSWSRSSPKFNRLFLGPVHNSGKNFMQIRLLRLSNQTDNQLDQKHNPPWYCGGT